MIAMQEDAAALAEHIGNDIQIPSQCLGRTCEGQLVTLVVGAIILHPSSHGRHGEVGATKIEIGSDVLIFDKVVFAFCRDSFGTIATENTAIDNILAKGSVPPSKVSYIGHTIDTQHPHLTHSIEFSSFQNCRLATVLHFFN